MTRPNIEAALERAERATEGPWRRGFWMGQCHIKHAHGTGCCVYQHTFREQPENPHHLAGPTPDAVVSGNYDYEEGGILREEDSVFIAAARTDLPEIARYALELERRIYSDHATTWKRATGNPGDGCPCDICTAVRARTP